jgi:hypothetical protein
MDPDRLETRLLRALDARDVNHDCAGERGQLEAVAEGCRAQPAEDGRCFWHLPIYTSKIRRSEKNLLTILGRNSVRHSLVGRRALPPCWCRRQRSDGKLQRGHALKFRTRLQGSV